MRRRHFKLKDGTFYDFGEHTYEDIVDVEVIRAHVGKDTLLQTGNLETAGRSYNKLAFLLGKKILRLFLEKVVDHLMNSDRITFGREKSMYIGLIKHNPERMVKASKQNDPLVHSGGKRYGVKMTGIGRDHYFRIPYRRRVELKDRIMKGQPFYG